MIFLDQGHSPQPVHILGEFFRDGLKEVPIEIIDDLQVPRQELFKQGYGPLFQGFGKHSVISEGKCCGYDLPGLRPWNVLLCMGDNFECTTSVSK